MTDHRPTVTDLLRVQHTEVRSLFAQIEQSAADQRAELFDCLRRLLAVHETAEEIVVHPAGRRLGDAADQVVDARLREEGAAKQLLADLERLGPDEEGFGSKFVELRQAVEVHAEAEEQELFPLLEGELGMGDLRQMGEQVEVAEAMAPTHPHPHGPESGLGNLLTGPFVAMVDKERDRLHAHAR
ncbi:MAG: hemerythrin domain-containing protein [Acidimicrobiales bacterium]|nr:hemerythrin domain-containing protein [Acidimicrobiales bacterium]